MIPSLDKLIDGLDISTDDGVNSACAKITNLNQEVNDRLNTLISRQCQIESKMNSIGRALPALAIVSNNTDALGDMIKHTAVLAETVSAKVRRLDEARSRVSECQQRVHDLIDLQLCSQGITTAIKDEDFEKGAGHIQRFLSMDQHLLQKTADNVAATGTINIAVATLEQATIQMRQIITSKFDEAVQIDDLASVERFFKIYPMLRLHNEGIDKFSQYICTKLEAKSQKELRTSMDVAKAEKRMSVAYADTITVLFENFARVVEVNQPIIENFYGNGYLIKMIITLQRECDDEIKRLLNEFQKNRHINLRIAQIHEELKINNNNSSSSGHQQQLLSLSGSSSMGHFRKPSGGSGATDKLNPKDIDTLIGEITVIHSRAELYMKFMRRKVLVDLDKSLTIDNNEKIAQSKLFEDTMNKSDLNRKMQELLGIYLLFERYFMEESVIKAISLDTFDQGQHCSSMVDDVFFIIKKSIRRSITTQSLDGVCAVLNNAASCLEGDFINALKLPLKSGYPSGFIDLAQAYSAFQTSIHQGKLQNSDTEQARMNFVIQLNNADMSTEYVETLRSRMNEEILANFSATMTKREQEILENCLLGLKSVGDTLKAVVDFGLQQLQSSAIKPRLHTWIDQFISLNHELTEDELSTYEAGETFIQSLIMQLDGFLNSFKEILNPRNFDALVSIIATDATTRLERAIKKCTFNRLGGLVLDQEIRAFVSYLISVTSWSIRDKMVRLTQIATLLNLEQVAELPEYYPSQSGGGSNASIWRFTNAEIRSILTHRVDFRMEDIKRLQL